MAPPPAVLSFQDSCAVVRARVCRPLGAPIVVAPALGRRRGPEGRLTTRLVGGHRLCSFYTSRYLFFSKLFLHLNS